MTAKSLMAKTTGFGSVWLLYFSWISKYLEGENGGGYKAN